MIRVIYDESRSGINYEPKYWPFQAERFALTLTERTSQATITVGPDAPDLPVSALLQDDSGPQTGIVWRVKSVNKDYNTNTRTINCEHAINALRDYVAFGEITPADITGNPNATTCSNLDVLHYVMRLPILEHGIGGEVPVPWRFGSVVALVSGAYTFNGDDAYSIVESVSATMHNPWWTYDFSQRPYVLSIVEAPEDKVCELRLDRNIRSLQVTEDRSRMYTRIWPIGRNDMKLTERYLEKNVSTYGVIDHTETNENMTTEADLRKWAGERLDYFSEPQLTISVNAMDLHGITGEELDRLKLGCRCSVVLPDYGKTFSQRVVSLRWNDTISDPMNVQITLANVREDVAAIISRQTKKASSGGRSSATTASKSLKDVTLTGPVNNIYSLKKVLNNGQTLPIGDFSRAVTSWSVVASADTLRVTAKPQEQTKEIPLRMGPITRSGYTYSGYVQYSGNNRASWINTNLQVKVDATEVTRLVNLADPEWTNEPSSAITGNSNTVTISTTGRSPNTSKSVSIYMNRGDWSAGKRYIYVTAGDSSADHRVARIEVDAHLSDPSWATAPSSSITGNSNSVTVSSVTGQSKTINLYMTRGNWSDGKRYVYTHQGDSTDANRIARIEVDAHLSDPSWATAPSAAISTNSNTVTVSSATGQSKSVALYMNAGGWSGGSNTVYVCQTDSSDANRVAKYDVSIPNPTNMSGISTYGQSPPSGGFGFGNLSKSGITAGRYMSMTARVGGKTFTFYFQVVA